MVVSKPQDGPVPHNAQATRLLRLQLLRRNRNHRRSKFGVSTTLRGARPGAPPRDRRPVTCATFPFPPSAGCNPERTPNQFGFFPKISTTVENTVEKPFLRTSSARGFSVFRRAPGRTSRRFHAGFRGGLPLRLPGEYD